MSLNLEPLPVVKICDPRTAIHKKEYGIFEGGSEVTPQFITTTNISNTAITFNLKVPSIQTFVNKNLYCQLPIRITLNCSSPNSNNLLRAGYDAPRAFPVNGSLVNLTSSFNGSQVSMDNGDIIHALLRYNADENIKDHDFSSTPSYLDYSQVYGDLAGSVRSPLSTYSDGQADKTSGRGAFNFKVVTNSPSQAVIDMICIEPLMLNPWTWNKGIGNTGFIGLQNIDVTLQFYTNSAFRMWSHDGSGAGAGGVIDSGSVQFNNFSPAFSFNDANVKLLIQYITPSNLQIIPPIVQYPYFRVQRFPQDFNNTVSAGSAFAISSQNIVLSSIPKRIYIYSRNSTQTLLSSPTYTDTYASLVSISCNINNRSGLLSQASVQQLYKMSIENGCSMTFEQWSGNRLYGATDFVNTIGTVGSILCIEMGKDIALPADQAPGMIMNMNMQFTLNFINNSSINMVPTLYIITIEEGVMNIVHQQTAFEIGVISPADILNAKEHNSPYVDYDDAYDLSGGNFLSGLKNFGVNLLGKIKSGIRKAYKFGKKIAPYIKTGIQVGSKILPYLLAAAGNDEEEDEEQEQHENPEDYQEDYDDSGDYEYDRDYGEGMALGGELVGGKMMRRSILKRRALRRRRR